MAEQAEGNRWPNRIIAYKRMKASELTSNPHNWREHPDAQRQGLVGLLDEVGQVYPVLYNERTGRLIDGHLRKDLDPDVEWDVAVVDLDEDEETAVLASLDPLGAMAATNRDKLGALLARVKPKHQELQAMLAGLREREGIGDNGKPPGDPGAALHRAEEWRDKWQVSRGQLWKVGRHSILCGDAYAEKDQYKLIQGRTIDLLHIDPPYGVDIVKPRGGLATAAIGGSKPFGATSGTRRKTGAAFRSARAERGHVQHGKPSKHQLYQSQEWPVMKGDVGRTNPANIVQSNFYPPIEGDDRPFEPEQFIAFAPIVIMWGANNFAHKLPPHQCWIVWDKRENITRNTFADCEIAWTNQDSPARLFHHLWNGLHKGSQHGERRTHPTEKPVALFEAIGKMYAPGGVWVDLFMGTGAQIVAAERVGAICLACEIEPLYVATALQRLADMGLEPRLAKETPAEAGASDG